MHACSGWLGRFARLALGVALLAQPVYATDLRSVLTEYTLASWSQKDGLPEGSTLALAQDGDGYMWVGTEAGPYRFDGARFTSWRALTNTSAPVASARTLHATADGSMWIGFGVPGGVAVFTRGRVRTYGPADGLPAVAVATLAEDASGRLWAGTAAGLFRLDGERWSRWGQDCGVADGPVTLEEHAAATTANATAGAILRMERVIEFMPLLETNANAELASR